MRYTLVGSLVGMLAVLSLALNPVFAAPPKDAVIDPGNGIGAAALGMTAVDLVRALGKEDFKTENDDGSVLYEWGLLTGGEVPDALIWAVVDGTVAVKIGTDAEQYQTSSGLHVGTAAEEFVKQYGTPAENPAPGMYVFPQGIGIAVQSDGSVGSVWIEQTASASQ